MVGAGCWLCPGWASGLSNFPPSPATTKWFRKPRWLLQSNRWVGVLRRAAVPALCSTRRTPAPAARGIRCMLMLGAERGPAPELLALPRPGWGLRDPRPCLLPPPRDVHPTTSSAAGGCGGVTVGDAGGRGHRGTLWRGGDGWHPVLHPDPTLASRREGNQTLSSPMASC